LRGQYVLLDFWATWCESCVSSFQELGKIHERLGRDGRVTILSLNLDEDPVAAGEMVQRKKLSWRQGTLGIRAADRDEILSRYAIGIVPTYILIGPDGKLIQRSDDLQVITQALSGGQR
jgi:thiol-disulfide isomerase/thioredoxin